MKNFLRRRKIFVVRHGREGGSNGARRFAVSAAVRIVLDPALSSLGKFASASGRSEHRCVVIGLCLPLQHCARRRLLRRLHLRCPIGGGTTMARLAALAADRGHVSTVRADGFAALATGFTGFFG